jgi:phosphohistidine phosphatase
MALELYLVRHGEAEERGEAYPDDSKRPLTQQGIKRMRQEAKGLEALGISFDQIITSPLVRARQTADALAETLKPHPPVVNSNALAPAGTMAEVFAELSRHARSRRIALVGHEPNMGALAARLIGSRTPLPFKKGGVCRIDFEALPPKGVGELQWFATPKILRRIR